MGTSYTTRICFLSTRKHRKIHTKLSTFKVRMRTRSSYTSFYASTRGCKLKCVTSHALTEPLMLIHEVANSSA